MENANKCKKCNRALPKDYKYKRCENCRNKQVKIIANAAKTLGVGALALLGKGLIKLIKR